VTITNVRSGYVENLRGGRNVVVEIYKADDIYVITTNCSWISDSGNYDLEDDIRNSLLGHNSDMARDQITWESDSAAFMASATELVVVIYLAGYIEGHLRRMYG